MQFIRTGPEIPEQLLQLHEEGRVVFFCGAGISGPAGLPGFSGLVRQLLDELGVSADAVQQTAIDAGQFDSAIGLLERGIVGGRGAVRQAIAKILTPGALTREATATHSALLDLSRTRSGSVHLVTTNFDRLFEEVIRTGAFGEVKTFAAPLLPVPKSHWNGLVYLHGRLVESPTADDLNHLVVSSGDFGLAYLTERWAARFVSELFRSYTVCFVGYSIGDPVLRYMMDALAADKLLGESPPEMFAFGSYSKGHEADRENEWRAKNVTPILYREFGTHAYLHKTLHAWGATYRDGVRGKEQIVVQHARANPTRSTQQEDFVGRMIWALSDKSGLPARRFAEFDPVPSLDWLEPLCEHRFGPEGLERFGVRPSSVADVADRALRFSLADRPAPHELAPRMKLVSSGPRSTKWDDVMAQLARWLSRHLGDPKLLEWIARGGNRLEPEFASQVRRALDELEKLERDGNHDELSRRRARSPNGVPSPEIRVCWRLLLAGRLKSHDPEFNLYDWLNRLELCGLTPTLRAELRGLLAPRAELRGIEVPEGSDGHPIVDFNITLAAEHSHSAFARARHLQCWKLALPDLLPDLAMLLRDALDLMRELGNADEHRDISYVQHPSIAEHHQNRDFYDWTALIDLTRDAWLATVPIVPDVARSAAQGWARAPYPLFRRLAFFAAAQSDLVPAHEALEWLLADGGWWLWSHGVQREVHQLLGPLAHRLDQHGFERLERAIIAGPSQSMLGEDIDATLRVLRLDRETWRRLAKLNAAGVRLGGAAAARLESLEDTYPNWKVPADDRDDFPVWITEGRREAPVATPRPRRALVAWLKANPEADEWEDNDWRQRCHVDFATTASALYALSKEAMWPVDRWGQALLAWSQGALSQKRAARRWRHMAPILSAAPLDVLRQLARDVSGWLRACAEKFDSHEALFFELCREVLAMADESTSASSDDPFTQALNHPVGQVTEALLLWAYRRELRDNQGLDARLFPLFNAVCDERSDHDRHGRVLLAAHVVTLFRVDPAWTRAHVLPLFEWGSAPIEAEAAWVGFLWSPRLYRPLMEEMKDGFLRTAEHYESLGRLGPQYAALLTHAALDRGDTFTAKELRDATDALPPEGLEEAARSLVHALEGAGTQRAEYWNNRVEPYLKTVWPKGIDRVTQRTSESFARLCVAAGKAFPRALEFLRPWIRPRALHDYEVEQLRDSGLCEEFPAESIELLDAAIGGEQAWLPHGLSACLEAIAKSKPESRQDRRFRRLEDLVGARRV